MFEAICGRDGFTRDFGRSGHENPSGAISWLTFFAGGAADVRRSRRDRRRELAESTICSQRKPRSLRCSAQSTGSLGVRRINVWAVSCGGFRPLMMAVVISGASQGRRKPIEVLAKEIHYHPLPDEVRTVIIASWTRGGLLPRATIEQMVPATQRASPQPSGAQISPRPE